MNRDRLVSSAGGVMSPRSSRFLFFRFSLSHLPRRIAGRKCIPNILCLQGLMYWFPFRKYLLFTQTPLVGRIPPPWKPILMNRRTQSVGRPKGNGRLESRKTDATARSADVKKSLRWAVLAAAVLSLSYFSCRWPWPKGRPAQAGRPGRGWPCWT